LVDLTDLTTGKDGVVFFLQIVNPKGQQIRFNGGGKIEAELVNIVSDIVSEKIKMVSTKNQRRKVISDSLHEAFSSLKKQTVKAI